MSVGVRHTQSELHDGFVRLVEEISNFFGCPT